MSGFGHSAKDLDEAICNNLVLTFLQLAHWKTKSVRITRWAMTLLEVFPWRGFRISSS